MIKRHRSGVPCGATLITAHKRGDRETRQAGTDIARWDSLLLLRFLCGHQLLVSALQASNQLQLRARSAGARCDTCYLSCPPPVVPSEDTEAGGQ